MKQDLLVRIFSDAHLIDLDWNSWDQEIAMLLLSDHYRHESRDLPDAAPEVH